MPAPEITWPVSYEGCPDAVDVFEGPDQQALFEAMAAEFLRRWTRDSYGTYEVVARPCRSDCAGGSFSTFHGNGPVSSGSMGRRYRWAAGVACGRCGTSCACAAVDMLRLPGPVVSITSVMVDGVEMDEAAYGTVDEAYLIRKDGERWPVCQDLSLDSTEEGTWEVTYQRGYAVPVGGQIAAGMLAVELAKAACNDSTCQLPKRLQSVTRQGVTMAVLDSFEDLDQGKTGVWLIDSWVASVRLSPRGGTVRTPDTEGRVRQWTS